MDSQDWFLKWYSKQTVTAVKAVLAEELCVKGGIYLVCFLVLISLRTDGKVLSQTVRMLKITMAISICKSFSFRLKFEHSYSLRQHNVIYRWHLVLKQGSKICTEENILISMLKHHRNSIPFLRGKGKNNFLQKYRESKMDWQFLKWNTTQTITSIKVVLKED